MSCLRNTSNLPIRYEAVVLVGPFAHQLRKAGGIQNTVNRPVDALPQVAKRRIRLPALTSPLLLPAFDKSQNVAHCNRFGPLCEQVTAFGATARFHESALLQAGQNQFQKLLWNLLSARDFGNFYRVGASVGRKIENGLKGVFTLDRNIH